MSENPTYYEFVARQPELEVVEFVPPPDSEACALRLALANLTHDRDYWRARARSLENRLARECAPTTGD